MKKQGWVLIAVTSAFLCLLLGIFLGRNSNKTYIQIQDIDSVQTQPATSTEALGKIDLNAATLEQLQLLPGIGEALAQRILDYREQHGNFTSIDELMKISGIGEKKFDNIKNFVKIG